MKYGESCHPQGHEEDRLRKHISLFRRVSATTNFQSQRSQLRDSPCYGAGKYELQHSLKYGESCHPQGHEEDRLRKVFLISCSLLRLPLLPGARNMTFKTINRR